MRISNREEYEAALARANALSDAPEGSAQAAEFAELEAALRTWNEARQGENSHGPEEVEGLLRPDDLPISGLPGNIGKLHKD